MDEGRIESRSIPVESLVDRDAASEVEIVEFARGLLG